MSFENISTIILAVISGCSVIVGAISLFQKKKANKNAESISQSAQAEIEQVNKRNNLFTKIITYINEAEQYFKGASNPVAKMTYVVTRTMFDALEMDVSISADEIKNYAELVLSAPQKKISEEECNK